MLISGVTPSVSVLAKPNNDSVAEFIVSVSAIVAVSNRKTPLLKFLKAKAKREVINRKREVRNRGIDENLKLPIENFLSGEKK